MNGGDRVAKDRHQQGIGNGGARELHAVGQLIGRDALQKQLARVSILALVPLQRQPKQANSGRQNDDKGRAEQEPYGNAERVWVAGLFQIHVMRARGN